MFALKAAMPLCSAAVAAALLGLGRAAAAVPVAAAVPPAALAEDGQDVCASPEDCPPKSELHLLQALARRHEKAEANLTAAHASAGAATAAEAGGSAKGLRDLVLMHVPYNFGHTVENVAMFGSSPLSAVGTVAYIASLGGFAEVTRQASWLEANLYTKPGGSVWGHLNPDLQVTSNVTGCPMYYTPQKYWPEELARKYFGKKTVFGLLRDPYERLVAFFRGGLEGYGGYFPKFLQDCDVNGAVKAMLKSYINGKDRFANGCTMLPQADFFEGPYGIQLPVDNRQFPKSMNDAFLQHGYPDYRIRQSDILHVVACPDVWAADLDEETRQMVREVYAKDFDLLCKHFGYCDRTEDCCIWRVPMMCPEKVMSQGYKGRPLNATA